MGGKSSKNNKKEESAPDEQQQQEEEQQQQASLLDQLADRAVVILTSKMSGKALRITEDGVDVSSQLTGFLTAARQTSVSSFSFR